MCHVRASVYVGTVYTEKDHRTFPLRAWNCCCVYVCTLSCAFPLSRRTVREDLTSQYGQLSPCSGHLSRCSTASRLRKHLLTGIGHGFRGMDATAYLACDCRLYVSSLAKGSSSLVIRGEALYTYFPVLTALDGMLPERWEGMVTLYRFVSELTQVQ